MRLHLVQRLVLGRHVIGGVAAPSAGSGGSGGTVLAAAAASGDRPGLGGGRKPRGLVSASRALPLCAEALRASDAEVRQAATELLVLCHARPRTAPRAAEAAATDAGGLLARSRSISPRRGGNSRERALETVRAPGAVRARGAARARRAGAASLLTLGNIMNRPDTAVGRGGIGGGGGIRLLPPGHAAASGGGGMVQARQASADIEARLVRTSH